MPSNVRKSVLILSPMLLVMLGVSPAQSSPALSSGAENSSNRSVPISTVITREQVRDEVVRRAGAIERFLKGLVGIKEVEQVATHCDFYSEDRNGHVHCGVYNQEFSSPNATLRNQRVEAQVFFDV
jgi:hypothetical protein